MEGRARAQSLLSCCLSISSIAPRGTIFLPRPARKATAWAMANTSTPKTEIEKQMALNLHIEDGSI
jgi:hypothetical protein